MSYLQVLEEVILETLEADPTWDTCPECKQEYSGGQRAFAQVPYGPSGAGGCLNHSGA